MAIKPNQKGVVTGTNTADKITWLSSKDWAKALTVNAKSGNDKIDFRKSKYKNNKLNGDAGNDTIWGGTNIDSINGGAGNDQLFGYNGNDIIYAGAGSDIVKGGNGNDKIYGQSGTNKLYGENGNDLITGGTGVDYIYAGNNNDTVKGGKGNDKIWGQTGTNQLDGEIGNDSITGGTGVDKIWGGKGNDTINAGAGKNVIYFNKSEGNDLINNGGGTDTLVFSQETNFNNFKFYYQGKNLVLSANGSAATLRNFANGGHSAKYVQAGKLKYNLTNGAGTAGNDLIMAAGTNDTITAGKGNDIINAGTGTNTIIYNTDDGLDTVISGGGTDTLLLNDEDNIYDIRRSFNGNDLTIKTKKIVGTNIEFFDIVTLKDYQTVTGGHSVQNIQLGESAPVDLMSVMNLMDGSTAVVNGTEYADDIYSTYQSQGAVYGTINAGAGNDVIHITDASDYPEVYLGTGSDVVQLQVKYTTVNTSSVGIHFSSGDGDNALYGLTNSINADSEIVLYSEDLLSSIDLGNNIGPYYYLKGTDGASDRVLTLSGGETFTVKNYNTVNASAKNTVRLIDDDLGFNDTIKDLPMFKNVVNLETTQNYYLHPTEPAGEWYKPYLVIAPDVNTSRTLTLDVGDNDVSIVEGSYHQTVNFNPEDSILYVHNTGEFNSDNYNTVNVNGNGNTVYISGGYRTTVDLQDGLDGGMNLKIYDGNNCNVDTDTGSSNIDINCGSSNSATQNHIYSKGNDNITIRPGSATYSKTTAHVLDDPGNKHDRTITMTQGKQQVTVVGAEDGNSINITKLLPNDTDGTHMTFEHYDAHADVEIRYRNAVDADANGAYGASVLLQGEWSAGHNSLDDVDVANKITFYMTKENGTDIVEDQTLKDMTQYVLINKDFGGPDIFASTTPGFDYEFNFTSGIVTNSLFSIRKDLYLDADDHCGDTLYSNYSFAKGRVTINDEGDQGGDDDKLTLNMARDDYRFFIDFNTDGHIAGKDLLIFKYTGDSATDGLRKYFGDNGHACDLNYIDGYVKITSAFDTTSGHDWYDGEGAIETIADTENTSFSVEDYIEDIKGSVAGWITSYNTAHGTSFTTVSQALLNGQANSGEINTLYGYYCANDISGDDHWNNLY